MKPPAICGDCGGNLEVVDRETVRVLAPAYGPEPYRLVDEERVTLCCEGCKRASEWPEPIGY